MGGYFLNFIVYTSAMIGIIFLAVFVYKQTSYTSNSNSKFLNVEDSMALSPRKRLYVVKAGDERFLIASDTERTTLISKLGSVNEPVNMPVTDSTVDDLPVIIDFKTKKQGGKTAEQVLKNIVHNI